ncbi:MAG: YggT family protein [Betaproteobacteria bacterium]
MNAAARFLLDTAFGILTYGFLLRFAMQWLRAPFRNPVGQALTALTDWAVKPMRRLVPGFAGIDWSTLLLAWLAQLLWLAALVTLSGHPAFDGATIATLALLAGVELLKASLWLLIVVVFAQAILSWTAPDGPLAGVLNALSFRFLAPIRRLVPPLGGTLDLSPLILIVLAQLALMLPVAWLESAVQMAFR